MRHLYSTFYLNTNNINNGKDIFREFFTWWILPPELMKRWQETPVMHSQAELVNALRLLAGSQD
jgi:hypothetical protein